MGESSDLTICILLERKTLDSTSFDRWVGGLTGGEERENQPADSIMYEMRQSKEKQPLDLVNSSRGG